MVTSPRPPATPFFAALLRTHAVIEERLKELERASDVLADPTQLGAAREAIGLVLASFDVVGKQHQDDEERTLFPRLKSLPAFAQMLGAYDFQHRMNDTEQQKLLEHLRTGQDAPSDLRRLVYRFAEMNRAHMMSEERALFPLVEEILPRDLLAEMEQELRAPNC